jgi:hypothetical protein
MADNKSAPIDNLHTKNGNFICGVVEGNAGSKRNIILAFAFSMYGVKVKYIKVYALIFKVHFLGYPEHTPQLFAMFKSFGTAIDI